MRWLLYHLLLSYDRRLGRMRCLILFNLRLVGGLFVVATPFVWWLDREYEQHGLRVTPVVVNRREVQVARDSGELTDKYVDVEYTDHRGGRHRQEIRNDRLPRECRWERVGVGDLLPEVEYLDYAPERFRFVVGQMPWWEIAFMGVGFLGAAALIRWSALWAPAGPDCFGGGSE